MVKITSDSTIEQFALHFLKGRIIWRDVPKMGITNFGSIMSMLLYRKPPFQVELLIVPDSTSSFPAHRHPDVDTVEFGLSGQGDLFVNGVASYTENQIQLWLAGNFKALPIHIGPTDWHSGAARTPYAFLSMQKWLHDVEPSSVGLNWEGETVSTKHDALLINTKLQSLEQEAMWHMTV